MERRPDALAFYRRDAAEAISRLRRSPDIPRGVDRHCEAESEGSGTIRAMRPPRLNRHAFGRLDKPLDRIDE
jgi:hypothetical protein